MDWKKKLHLGPLRENGESLLGPIFKRFWFPTITSDEHAYKATVWGCLGYVWLGGGTMACALINAAGWMEIEISVESGIVLGAYAAIFGWLTWTQSYVGTQIGFAIFALANLASILSDFSGLRGWFAIVGQGTLLLNGVRAARYRYNQRVSSKLHGQSMGELQGQDEARKAAAIRAEQNRELHVDLQRLRQQKNAQSSAVPEPLESPSASIPAPSIDVP